MRLTARRSCGARRGPYSRRSLCAWAMPAARSRLGRRLLSDPFELGEIVPLARRHEEILLPVALLPLARDEAAVVNRDLARADDLEFLTAHDDCRALVQPDAQQVAMLRDHFLEIVLAVAREHMLIDRYTFDQAEAFLIAWRHHGVV